MLTTILTVIGALTAVLTLLNGVLDAATKVKALRKDEAKARRPRPVGYSPARRPRVHHR